MFIFFATIDENESFINVIHLCFLAITDTEY